MIAADLTADTLVRSGARFLALSMASFLVTLGATALCHEILNLSAEVSYLVALIVAFFQNFLGMRYFVYPGSETALVTQLIQFFWSSVAFRIAEYIVFLLLHSWLNVPYLIAAATIMLASFLAKFLFYRVAVFR